MFSSNTSQVSNDVNYIEDVFSTYLYTGNGSTQTITNGIDLAGEGGLVWLKSRSNALNNVLIDSARGASGGIYKPLFSNLTNAENTAPSYGVTSLNADGFSLGPPGSQSITNESGYTYASWTFRKQPKFFDVVTYTGNGVLGRTISHNLGSAPGFMVVKCTSSAADWPCYHRALGPSYSTLLNLSDAAYNTRDDWVNGSLVPTAPTATQFTVSDGFGVNANGQTYVAYLFAHNAGGFGLTGTDNVISCGSYTGTGAAGNAINLGYEAQWVMIKRTDSEGYDWNMFDVMRGMPVSGGSSRLSANTSAAEITGTTPIVIPTATGFSLEATTAAFNGSGGDYIYIAIRRGPMKTPTSGTSVFSPNAVSDDTAPATTSFPVDLLIENRRTGFTNNSLAFSRLTGGGQSLVTSSTAAEFNAGGSAKFESNTSITPNVFGAASLILWNFRRAPGFFDEVCYTGTGSATTVTHNLGVAPELMIVKQRSSTTGWVVYSSALAASDYLVLNNTSASQTASTIWNSTAPTSSVFSVGTSTTTNTSSGTYVAYLFASVPGVSKVGSYTGTGTTQQINCGFTAGARFVLIKRTDSTGDWYVWDSARGIVAGNDPYLLLNSTAAEVTTTDYVDTFSSGFEISSTAPAAINASGGTFIYLAIA